MAQKPNPKNYVTVGRLKQIIAQNNKDKNDILQRRKAIGVDMSEASPEDIKDQIRLAQIEDQNSRYGGLITKALKDSAAKSKNMVTVGRLNQIADSLYKVAGDKKSSGLSLLMQGNITDKKRDKINAYNSSASNDMSRADRYRALAKNAVIEAKNKAKK